eukprot:352935_1
MAVYWAYLQSQKVRHTTKSFLRFAEACYGDAYQLQKDVHEYHEEINDCGSSSCQKHLHPKQSCGEYIGFGALRWVNIFKWFVKFHLCLYSFFGIAKTILNKRLLKPQLMSNILSKTVR